MPGTISDFKKDFQTMDLSSSYRSELADAQAGGNRGGTMHLSYAAQTEGDPKTLKIVAAPLQSIVVDGVTKRVWGPVPSDCRFSPDNAGDPVQPGTYLVEPDGSYGIWQKGVGYVEQPGTAPAAAFGPDGICITAGFTPGGVWYSVGDKSEHPSNGGKPPGLPPAGGASISAMARELLAAAVAKGV